MTIRSILALLVSFGLAPQASAVEVSSIVSCKPDGKVWLCGAWKQGRVEVFRSETYFTQVEFDAPPEAQLQAAMEGGRAGRSAEPRASAPSYTLQLMACRADACVEKTGLLAIPGSREVPIIRAGQQWYVLAVGEYVSVKAAQQAAARLIVDYKLRNKPWIRTLDSLEQHRATR